MILGVIPARAGSKGIPHKNSAPFLGKSLIEWTLDKLPLINGLDDVICTTDCPRVAQICADYNIDVLTRPQNLASDHSTIVDVLKYVLSQYHHSGHISHIVLLQPTSPFTLSETVTKCISLALNSSCDTVITGHSDPANHPSLIFSTDALGRVDFLKSDEIISRRQDFSPFLKRSGCCYVIKKETLLLHNSLYGSDVRSVQVSKKESTNIDEPSDIIVAQAVYGSTTDGRRW